MRYGQKYLCCFFFSSQSNFHIFYYFYDGLNAKNELPNYTLENHRSYKYLKVDQNENKQTAPRYNQDLNIKKFEDLQEVFRTFNFSEEQIDTIYNTLAAILLLGEINFKEGEADEAGIDNQEEVEKAARLLKVDEKKLCWSLINYCLVKKNVALKKVNDCNEAIRARDVLANNLYSRLVDYIIAVLNHKLSFGRAIL